MRKTIVIFLGTCLAGCQGVRVERPSTGAGLVHLFAVPQKDGEASAEMAVVDAQGNVALAGQASPAAPEAPAQTVQLLLEGPDGPRLVSLQVAVGDLGLLGDYAGKGPMRAALQPAPAQATAAISPPAVPVADQTVQLMQHELTRQICLQIKELKGKVQDLSTRVKLRPESPKEGPTATVKAGAQDLKQQVTDLNKRMDTLKTTEKMPIAAPRAFPATPIAPCALTVPSTPAPTTPAKLDAACGKEGCPTVSQQEVNRLLTQCIYELKREIQDLNTRLSPPATTARAGS